MDIHSENTNLLEYLLFSHILMAKIIDNIIFLPNKYKEEDMVIVRVTEKEI